MGKKTKHECFDCQPAEPPPRCIGVRDVPCDRLPTHGERCQECFEQEARLRQQGGNVNTPDKWRHGRAAEAVIRQYDGWD